jgi:hypothetical protein
LLNEIKSGIIIEELPAVDGIKAEQEIYGSTYTVITKSKLDSQNDYWLVNERRTDPEIKFDLECDTKLIYNPNIRYGDYSEHFFKGGRDLGERDFEGWRNKSLREISAKRLEEFMPLVEALEKRTGNLLVKYAIRRRK